VLAFYSAAAVFLNRRRAPDLIAWTVPVLGAVSTFFAFMLVAVSSPFGTQTAPLQGAGLNPSLQNPYMLAHPPLLYLGYVGLTVPFAFGMGALLAGRTDERWIVATRRWTLVAWTALGVGMFHTCGVQGGGLLTCWGWNASGQLGDGTTTNRLAPAKVSTPTTWVDVDGGYAHTVGSRNVPPGG